MKKTVLTFIISLMVCLQAGAWTDVRIDFGTAYTDPSGNWNTTTLAGNLTDYVDYYTGLNTGIGLTPSGFSSTTIDSWSGATIDWVDAAAAEDAAWIGASGATLTINGLEVGQEYKIELVSALYLDLERLPTFTIDGAIADISHNDNTNETYLTNWDMNEAYKNSDWLIWNGIVSSDGTLTLDIDLTHSPSQTGYISAMHITTVPEPASALMLTFAGLMIGGYRRFFSRD